MQSLNVAIFILLTGHVVVHQHCKLRGAAERVRKCPFAIVDARGASDQTSQM